MPRNTCAKTTGAVDDGSGKTIELVYFKQDPNRQNTGRFVRPNGAQNIDFRSIRLHSVVKAKGEISEFRDNRQITLRKIGMWQRFALVGWSARLTGKKKTAQN